MTTLAARKHWKVLAHHPWTYGATIAESVNVDDPTERRFTATIRGFRNWKIRQGKNTPDSATAVADVIKRVEAIRDRIDAGDEVVFTEPNEYEVTA